MQITNSDLGLDVLDKIKLDENDNFEKSYNLGISRDIEAGTYPINVYLAYSNKRLPKTLDIEVKDCETGNKKESGIVLAQQTPAQPASPSAMQNAPAAKQTRISFTDTNEYLILIAVSFVLLSGAICFMLVYIAVKLL